MTITTCPKCGSMNITTAGTCANCGWSQFAQVTVSSGVYKTIGEIEIKETGKALLEDYKRLLFENNSLTNRIAELEKALNIDTDLTIAGLRKELRDATARIAELEEKQRWIPVSERMPDDWESVLTIDISKSTQDVVTAFYNPEMSLWSTHFSYDLWVTHWMPLPELPIVYGKECEE